MEKQTAQSPSRTNHGGWWARAYVPKQVLVRRPSQMESHYPRSQPHQQVISRIQRSMVLLQGQRSM
eukprot:2157407-Pleurochrysis_carterae.AAC.1